MMRTVSDGTVSVDALIFVTCRMAMWHRFGCALHNFVSSDIDGHSRALTAAQHYLGQQKVGNSRRSAIPLSVQCHSYKSQAILAISLECCVGSSTSMTQTLLHSTLITQHNFKQHRHLIDSCYNYSSFSPLTTSACSGRICCFAHTRSLAPTLQLAVSTEPLSP